MYSYWVVALPSTTIVLLNLYSHITMELLAMENDGILGIIIQKNGILKTL